MRLLRLPGVHRPVSDTWMLLRELSALGLAGRAVADLCTGSGVLAVAAASMGASPVVAVDVSRRAALATRLNARLNRRQVSVRRGDLFTALGCERFDVIVSNPPYVPAPTDRLPRHRRETALDGGRDGRALLDRICAGAPPHLRPRGQVLVVHSSVCDEALTCRRLEEAGLQAEVRLRVRGPLGPVLRERAPMMRARGLLGEAEEEEIVVVSGRAGP